MTRTLRVGHIVEDTEAEGPGRRFAIWVQGCPLRCAQCCNPELLPFRGGTEWPVPALVERILTTSDIEGVSLLGGEPTAQAAALAPLAEAVRQAGLTVMLFSGYTLAELRARTRSDIDQLLAHTDLLVDGRYEHQQPDDSRRWIGSANQELHFLSDRYSPTDRRFFQRQTVELRLTRGDLLVNGWPAAADQLLAPDVGASGE